MIVTFVIDTSASMNQSTSNGMTMLDYAKSAVERFVKRVRDPSRRYQHHFMLVSCGADNALANSHQNTHQGAPNNGEQHWNGRVRIGWDQSTNKDAFLMELKNLRANDLSDIGSSLKQAFELMNQIRLQFNWDTYGLGRSPWNTNVAVCILLTDATTLSSLDGQIQDSLLIPTSNQVGADLTLEPFRWDQRLYTIALKLSATMGAGVKAQPSFPTDLMALSEATGGMLYVPTAKSAVEQSVDQIIQKLKAGAVIKFKCEIGEGDEIPFSRNTITTFSGKEYNWPIPESFWLDRNSNSLPPREAQPTLTFRRTVENAVESATSHMLLDTLKFPADTYMIDNSTNPTPPRGQRWMVYVAGSRGEGRLGDPIGFIRASPAGSTTAGSGNNLLVLLPYNYPTLFGLIVEAARVFQASGQNINSPTGVWAFQPKAMPSSWRESFNAYVTGCPIYYYAPLKKVLRKYNLQDLIPDVQDSGRSYQLSNMLNRLREQSITESESSNKTNARPLIRLDSSGGVSISTSTKAPSRSSSAVAEASPSASPLHSRNDKDVTSSFAMDSMVMNIATMSLKELLQSHQRSKKHVFDHQGSQNQGLHLLPSPPVTSSLLTPIPKRFENLKRSSDSATISEVTLKLAPSWRAKDEDEKHYQPIDTMSDYESRLIKKEALRNPLGEPEPDEDTPMGLRRRQLCFNLGNPYKKSASKQQSSNVYQGEAADEAAALGGQSPKRQRTRKRSSQLKKEKNKAKRERTSPRPPGSPSLSSPESPGSSTGSSSPGSPSGSPSSSHIYSSPSSTISCPGRSEGGESAATSEESIESISDQSIKSRTARLLGVSLEEHVGDKDDDSSNQISLSKEIHRLLVENAEAWQAAVRIMKSQYVSRMEEEQLLKLLEEMKGGELSVQGYINHALYYLRDYKKQHLVQRVEELQKRLQKKSHSVKVSIPVVEA